MKPNLFSSNPIIRYVLPFFVFMIFTEFQRFYSDERVFLIYGLKIALTGALLLFLFSGRRHEIPGAFTLPAAAISAALLLIWIALGEFFIGEKDASFEPNAVHNQSLLPLLFGIRILGASVVVPFMEELLWRSFLMRYLIKPDFLKVPLGAYSPLSFWGTVLAFTLVHKPWEWPAAVVFSIIVGFYLIKTKNLMACIQIHALVNLGLALYVLIFKKWYFW